MTCPRHVQDAGLKLKAPLLQEAISSEWLAVVDWNRALFDGVQNYYTQRLFTPLAVNRRALRWRAKLLRRDGPTDLRAVRRPAGPLLLRPCGIDRHRRSGRRASTAPACRG